LEKGRDLFGADGPIRHVYFPTDGLVSIVGLTAGGGMVELGAVAHDGCIGLSEVWAVAATPHQATVCLPGAALRLEKQTLRVAMDKDEVMRKTLLDHASRWSPELAQGIVCHRFHTVLQRLCRWLLTAVDRTDLSVLEITHETLAHLLGVAHPVLSRAALELHDAAAIQTRRGRIVLLNRRLLEQSACECYNLIRHVAPSAVGSRLGAGR
jgi:CRP-like cAMP-binding protein